MAQRKILSKRFLEFLGKQGASSVSGKRGLIELHHESIFTGFTGGRKKYNDYQALPLTKQEHDDRHSLGLAYWVQVDLDPVKIVTGLLQEYRNTLSPFSFKTEVEYEEEIALVEEHIAELEERLEK